MTATSDRPRITTLPQSVADRIAAGEVVERPASVAKELVENALDAGAQKISVVVKDAGRTLIRIVDDGTGMTQSELAAAIGRHTTSKIARFEDLETLSTFGFRGEALPSVVSVSRCEILSRTVYDDVGTRLKISGGRVDSCEPAAAPQGTSVSIEHLFYNVPARRKFLRQDSTEFKWIAAVFKHLALAFPEVAWELHRDGELLYDFAASDRRARLGSLFGDDVAEEMIEINLERGWLRVQGFITPPSMTQRSNSDQYLFLNRRPISSPRLNRAIYTACEPYFVSGGHPIYEINLEAAPDRFDINVHPAKKEVKFADEGGAFSGLWAAVRSAIATTRAPAEMRPPLTPPPQSGGGRGAFPQGQGGRGAFPQGDRVGGVDPYYWEGKGVDPQSRECKGNDSQTLGDTIKPLPTVPPGGIQGVASRSGGERLHVDSPAHLTPYVPVPRQHLEPRQPAAPFPGDRPRDGTSAQISPLPEIESTEGPFIFQAFDTFIVSPLKTGLVFIDQHIAHERILFEQSLQSMDKEPWTSQQLLFPTGFSVHAEDVPIVEEMLPLMRAMGFAIEAFGPREFRILAVPSGVRIASEREMVLGIIEEFRDTASTESDPRHRLAAAFACRGAVKAGQPLEIPEMQRLIDELFRTQDPEFCPHGRPIYHVLNRREIEKWFKR